MDGTTFGDLHTGADVTISSAHSNVLQAIEKLLSSGLNPDLLAVLPELLNDRFRPQIMAIMLAVEYQAFTPAEVRALTQSLTARASGTYSQTIYQPVKQIGETPSSMPIDYRLSGGTLCNGPNDSYLPWNFENPRTSVESTNIHFSGVSQNWPEQPISDPIFEPSADLGLATSGGPESVGVPLLDLTHQDKLQPHHQIPGRSLNDTVNHGTSDVDMGEQRVQDGMSYEELPEWASPENKVSHELSLSSRRDFIPFKPQRIKARERPLYCPECNRDFTSVREFLCHTYAEHDQPIKFRCHHTVTVRGKMSRCSHKSFVFSRFRRHHTTDHPECIFSKGSGDEYPACCHHIPNPRPRKYWGCGICRHLSETADDWVTHHTQVHRGQERNAASRATLLQSYVSHPLVWPIWEDAIRKLYLVVDAIWQHPCSLDQETDQNHILMAFKTGLWKERDIYADPQASQDIIATILKMVGQKAKTDAPTPEHSSNNRESTSPPRGRSRSFCSLLRKRSKSMINQQPTSAVTMASNVPQLPVNNAYLTFK